MKQRPGRVHLAIVLAWLYACPLFSVQIKSEGRKNQRIVFLSDRGKSKRQFDLYTMDLGDLKAVNLTGDRRDVSLRSNSLPKLNRERNSVLFISFNPRNLVEMDLTTRAVRTVAELRYEATDYCIAPDGRSVVYTEKTDSTLQLFGIDLRRGVKRNLSNNRFNNFEASFSSDGSKVVYVCDQDGSNSIAIMNADGSGQRMLTNPFGDDRYPKFSPDDRQIVFSSSRSGLTDSDYGLYTIDITGSPFALFYQSKTFNTQPQFSPDRAYVAFVSNARGPLTRDIFLKDLKTGAVEPITSELTYLSGNINITDDGQCIVFENIGPSDSEIWMYQRKTRQLRNITKHPGRDISPSL